MPQYLPSARFSYMLKSKIDNTQRKQVLSEILIRLQKNQSKLIKIDEKMLSSTNPVISLSKNDTISFSISNNTFEIVLSLANQKYVGISQKIVDDIHNSLKSIKFLKLFSSAMTVSYSESQTLDFTRLIDYSMLSEYGKFLNMKLVPFSLMLQSKLNKWSITCMPLDMPEHAKLTKKKSRFVTLIVVSKVFKTPKNMLKESNVVLRTVQRNFKNLKKVKKV